MALSQQEITLTTILVIVAAVASSISSIYLIFILWRKRSEKPSMNDVIPPQILFYIVCTDFAGDIIYILGALLSPNVSSALYSICVIEGLANTFFEFTLLLLVTSIGF